MAERELPDSSLLGRAPIDLQSTTMSFIHSTRTHGGFMPCFNLCPLIASTYHVLGSNSHTTRTAASSRYLNLVPTSNAPPIVAQRACIQGSSLPKNILTWQKHDDPGIGNSCHWPICRPSPTCDASRHLTIFFS
jgi:hypothetical protein